MENEEIKYLDYQIIALGINIIIAITSIVIIYNRQLNLSGKKKIMTSDTQTTLTYITKLIALGLSFMYLYVNYKQYELAKEENEDIRPFELQIFAGILVVISAVITTYSLFAYSNEEANLENPEI